MQFELLPLSWRCKAYGHRTGDRECPMRTSGNNKLEEERRIREDPMKGLEYCEDVGDGGDKEEDIDHDYADTVAVLLQLDQETGASSSSSTKMFRNKSRLEFLKELIEEIRREEKNREKKKRDSKKDKESKKKDKHSKKHKKKKKQKRKRDYDSSSVSTISS